jgi:hypothetical protein
MSGKSKSFRKRFIQEVEKGLSRFSPQGILTDDDIQHLPEIVKKYLTYTGVLGKPKLQNVRIKFTGDFKQKPGGKWMKFKSIQYNFFDEPTRLFYIRSTLFGIPLIGLHSYLGQNATMEIKIASLFKVADAKGKEMNRSETVTMLNDMCLMAPASLINKNIKWKIIDPITVNAEFTNQGNTISAVLYFKESGELLNFISDDRYMSADGKTYNNYRWSTPVKEYKEINGIKVLSYGEAIWQRPEGEFCYGKFKLQEIEFNCKETGI